MSSVLKIFIESLKDVLCLEACHFIIYGAPKDLAWFVADKRNQKMTVHCQY